IQMLILQTERLSLREFIPEDVDALTLLLSDAHTMRFYPAPLGRAGVLEWIDRNRRRYADIGHGLWAIILNSTGDLIPGCGLARQNVDGVAEIEIGYHVRRDHWGKGYAPEAARACRNYGFAKLNVERLISLIRSENVPSRRVAEKIGMKIWKEVVWREFAHLIYVIHRAELPT